MLAFKYTSKLPNKNESVHAIDEFQSGYQGAPDARITDHHVGPRQWEYGTGSSVNLASTAASIVDAAAGAASSSDAPINANAGDARGGEGIRYRYGGFQLTSMRLLLG